MEKYLLTLKDINIYFPVFQVHILVHINLKVVDIDNKKESGQEKITTEFFIVVPLTL